MVANGFVPDSERGKIAQQVLVDNGEFSRQDTSVVNVGGKRLGALVVSQDLGGGSRGHGGDEQRVAQSVLGDFGLERGPVPAAGGGDTPEIELELSLAGRRTGVRLVVAFRLGEEATGRAGTKVDGLENVTVQLGSTVRVKGDLEHGKGIGKTLDTESDRTVLHVGVSCLFDGVKVAVNDSVQVAGQGHGNITKLFEIEFERTRGVDASNEHGETDTGKVANGGLVLGSVLNNLGTEVRRLDGTQVLLIGLAVAGVLVEHVRSSGLDLGIQNGKPQLLRIDRFASLALGLVFFVEFLELLSVALGEAGALVGAHESPLSVGLDALHEQVRNPQGVKQITGTVGLVSVVLSEVQKGKDISVPWFEVNGNASLALAAALVDVSGSVIKDAKHGNDSIGSSVRSANVGLACTNVVAGKTDSTGVFGNDRAVLEGVVDSVDRVLLHGQEKARGHLRGASSGIEQCGCGVGEVFLGEAFVGLEDAVNVVSVDSNGHTHEHALRSFGNHSIHLEEVGLFQSLVSKVIVFKVTGVVDGFVENVLVLHDRVVVFLGNKGAGLAGDGVNVVVEFLGQLRKDFNGRFLEIGNGNSGGKDGIIRVLCGEGCGGLGSESIKEERTISQTVKNARNQSMFLSMTGN